MKIRICGKRVMKGNSKKTGNLYHFTEVHFLGSNPDVEGSTCETAIIQAEMCAPDAITVGNSFDLEYNKDGRVVSFAPCK